MVISSTRFGSRHGTFWQQVRNSVRRHGLPLTLWLGCDIIAVQFVTTVARVVLWITGRPADLATLPTLTALRGARFLKTANINDAATLAAVSEYSPDLIVVMNFDQILGRQLIEKPRLGVLNVHPALLPELRGPCPVIWALMQGRAMSGASIHIIEDETIDSGRILAQAEVAIDGSQSVARINAALFLAGARNLGAAISALRANPTAGSVQDSSRASYLGFPTREEMVAFRRAGLRLCRLSDLFHLLAAASGLGSWRS
ncbi:Formyl transferase [Enhydrobacter aerosaccus]|uniref:Formyl transferase n=2 Tax=Enhydrobacter aerosaccus TaxID=225324 RepID=A0A1T4SCM5_9HYPH|nr:Formyl transferase [Enhydrobacter aerosaccus]